MTGFCRGAACHRRRAERRGLRLAAGWRSAPGGAAEMSTTAQLLRLDVPLVTARQVLRVIVLTVGAVLIYRWYARRVGGVG